MLESYTLENHKCIGAMVNSHHLQRSPVAIYTLLCVSSPR